MADVVGDGVGAVAAPRRHRLRHSAALPGEAVRLLGGGGEVGLAAAEAAADQSAECPLDTADVLVEARELRALLPRMWRHFRRPAGGGKSSDASAGKQSVTFPVQQLHVWLQSLKSLKSKWGEVTDQMLVGAVRTAAQLPPLRQRMGFRFQDPSENGSWSASNLVGYAERPVGPIKRSRSHVSWDSYVANFRMQVTEDQGVVQVQRNMARKAVVAHVEKRRRGDPEGPLAREPIVVTAASRCGLAVDRRKRIRVERGSIDLLPAVVFRPPSGQQQWTLIYLHGLGGSAQEYADRPHYFFDGSIALKVMVPTAPRREVSCFDTWWLKAKNTGWRLAKFQAWFDYLSNHDGAREDAIDWQSLHAVRRALHSVVQKEALELGGRTDRVLLGGKSQGCCTALDAALTFPKPLGGFIGVVGHLLSCTPVEPEGPQRATPLHFFHEPEDTIMRWDWVQKGERRLRDAGYRVRSRRNPDPASHGHFVEGVEGAWIRAALRSICGGEGEEE